MNLKLKDGYSYGNGIDGVQTIYREVNGKSRRRVQWSGRLLELFRPGSVDNLYLEAVLEQDWQVVAHKLHVTLSWESPWIEVEQEAPVSVDSVRFLNDPARQFLALSALLVVLSMYVGGLYDIFQQYSQWNWKLVLALFTHTCMGVALVFTVRGLYRR